MTSPLSTATTSAAGQSLTSLRELVKKDLDASNALRSRLEQTRKDVAEGKAIPAEFRSLMDQSNRALTHDLIQRIEQIEKLAGLLTATDREMLQALNARLAVCDLQAARIAELADLMGVRGNGFLGPAGSYRRVLRERVLLETRRPLVESNLPPALTSRLKPQPIFQLESFGRVPTVTPLPDLQNESNLFQQLNIKDDAEHEYVYVDEEGREVQISEADHQLQHPSESDKSSWPLLWRILDLSPTTSTAQLPTELQRAKAKQALLHDPKNFPNDADAPRRWAAVTKACSVISDAEKRGFYRYHEKLPEELVGFEFGPVSREAEGV